MENSQETPVNEEIIDKPTPDDKIRNFKYLDDLIHSGAKEIVLDSDIILSENEESSYKRGIEINVDDLIIDGNGHTIDARGKVRIFLSIGENTTIKNITLKNGFAGVLDGGAILNNWGKLNIVESTLINNVAGRGGAIRSDGDLTIRESTLKCNTADSYGGAIHIYKCNLTMVKSTLNENCAEWGGAINSNKSELSIIETAFLGNMSKYGGAVENAGGQLEIISCLLKGNRSNSFGGAINNPKGSLKIFDCEILNNESSINIIMNVDSLQVHNTDFRDNQSNYIITNHGNMSNLGIFIGEFIENNVKSVIDNSGKSCSIEKTIFENNNSSEIIINNTDLVLINPIIKDGEKTILNEGHIIIKNESTNLLNKIYGEGKVEVYGDFVPKEEKFDFGYLDKLIHESVGEEIILEEDICFENYENDFYEGGIELDIGNLVIDGKGHTIDAADKSRIFIITGKNITLKNITFKNGYSHRNYDNPMNNNGGAIKINHDANIVIENCEFISNKSEENGGAIQNSGEFNISETVFNENVSYADGGALSNDGELNIVGSTFNSNNSERSNGGALSNDGELNIVESTINQNFTGFGGGAINNIGELTISKSIINKNHSAYRGGAIHNVRGGECNIIDSIFNENRASKNGGAIYIEDYTKYKSNNCTFKDNIPDDVYEYKE